MLDLVADRLAGRSVAAPAGQRRAGARRRRPSSAGCSPTARAPSCWSPAAAVLRLRGEHDVPLGPLPPGRPPAVAGGRRPAVQLFADRARRGRSGVRARPTATAGAVAEVVRRLDGLPAGRRARRRPGAHAAAAGRCCAASDAGALDLPGATSTLPDRQRTLRATIAWSHDLLARRRAGAAGPAVGLRRRRHARHGGGGRRRRRRPRRPGGRCPRWSGTAW